MKTQHIEFSTNKIIKLIISLILCIIVMCVSVNAESKEYIYDAWNNSVPSPATYSFKSKLANDDFGDKGLKDPSDLFVDENGYIYIADSGNNRIVILNSDFTFIKEITNYFEDEIEKQIIQPKGIYVDADNIYICEPENKRIIKLDSQQQLLSVFQKPETELYPDNIEFKPSKVVVNHLGTVFALVDGLYLGAISYDCDGEFLGFYGANDVEITISLLLDYAWKQIMSQEQVDNMKRYVPIAFSGFDVSKDNFIYTCTNTAESSLYEIRKLNAMGNDVIINYPHNLSSANNNYGDLEEGWFLGQHEDTQFVDIFINDDSLIFALDYKRGKVFQYDQEGILLNVFGGIGSQDGAFSIPTAIDGHNNYLYILDKADGTVSIFEKTEHGVLLETAIKLHNSGNYVDAKETWIQIIKQNNNSTVANIGIGKALYEEGNYKEAMNYFKMGYDRNGYSRAFEQYRMTTIRNWFPIIFIAIVGILLMLYLKFKLQIRVNLPFVQKAKLTNTYGVLTSPLNTFEKLKYYGNWKLYPSFIILLLLFMVLSIEKQYTNFKFNYNNIDDINIVLIAVAVFSVASAWSVINWAITTLMEGKGKIKEIWIATAYCLLPYIIATLLKVILSHYFIIEEAAFLGIIQFIGMAWSVLLIFGASATIHDYTFNRNIGSLILTLLGILFVVFLLVLFFGLIQHVTQFVQTIYMEYMIRS